MEFNFTVTGDRLRLAKKQAMVSGNAGSYICNFEFSESFKGLTAFAVFAVNGEYINTEIKENKCIVPHEATKEEQIIRIGVFATNGNSENFKRISTNYIDINIETGAYSIYSAPKTPDLWETYLGEIQKERECAENAAQAAAQKVTENVGEMIKQEVLLQREDIVAEVLLSLPDGDEVSY